MQGTVATLAGISFDGRRLYRQIVGETDLRAVALVLSVVVGATLLHRLPVTAPPRIAKAPSPVALPVMASVSTVASNPFGGLVPSPYGELILPQSFQRSTPVLVPQQASHEAEPVPVAPSTIIASLEEIPLPPRREVAEPTESAPLPPVRPAELESPEAPPAPLRHSAQPTAKTAAPAAPSDNRTFIEKLFGIQPHSGTALGYAAPETSAIGRNAAVNALPGNGAAAPSGLFGLGRSAPSVTSLGYDQYTAVYDLSAHMVYLPNGTRLEAHSGLGDRLDDPNHVNERMHGATPPHLYELQPREASFHGVQALRLNPIGSGDIFGRAGLLAHSYMLGPNGDSNGCVSFKDYDAFLRAYQNGEIKKLAVVARL
jgi:hypothetical protein